MKLSPIDVIPNTQIQYLSHELLFLAQSGQPYRGSVYINFVTLTQSFNLLDFKSYLTSLRSQNFIAENIAYDIYQTIDQSIQTKDLGVSVDLSARGGIQQRICFGVPFEVVKKSNVFQVG